MFDDAFMPISVATLVPSAALDVDLYRMTADGGWPVLFRSSAYPLEMADILRLREHGISRLYIPCEDRAAYQSQLRRLAEGDDQIGDVPMAVRAGALNDIFRDVLKGSFDRNNVDDIVADAGELAELACALVCHEEFAARDLLRVLHHDYATFTHSVNVALYAAILAKALGFSRNEMSQVTAGGLVHDLGKLAVANAILWKPGPLTNNEFRAIRRHPREGFRQLCHRDDLCRGQLMMVYQHHERLDGRGYPVGITGEDIHPWAKLCSVVDVFEALTSNRPYRKRMQRSTAIELLQRDAGIAFDSEMVKCWLSTVHIGSAG